MRAILYTNPKEFSVAEVPTPECKPHQVLIKVMACGICKTDLHIHDGSFISKFPLINGHEFAGTVAAVGSAVTEWKVGDRVTADNTELCGY
ncbi:MAG: alcohol dehydrogenase catalytic domain-containing protein, partial [Eubacteriales bacterium]|nr:alcohol dehydrogenase catalytic domain-containing protein [Eubacteriales bacterium]